MTNFFRFYHGQQKRFIHQCNDCGAWYEEEPTTCRCKESEQKATDTKENAS